MAHPQYNQYQQNMHNVPPLQTQNHLPPQRAYSPQNYQQSPGAMSPTSGGGMHPAKRQRVSPQPNSPYHSPFSASPYSASPYATSPPGNQYLNLPHSPANTQPPTPSFHQPQPYHPHNMPPDARPPPQSSMPPPRVPYSKTQEPTELEKANPKDSDPASLTDVLTNSGIILRDEEDFMLNITMRNHDTSFNSQNSTASPQGSFNQWSQQSNHGAFQGTGPLSQPVTKEQQEAELVRKHQEAARILNETSSQPLADPFLFAAVLRQRMARRAYEHGIKIDLDGLFDKIPENVPSNVTRHNINGGDEAIVGLQATSLLNHNAPLVEFLSLLSLATEERVRTVVEDAFALAQGRQTSSHGVVPPNLADLAVANGGLQRTEAVVPNISKTAWEAPDGAVSPMTVTAQKQPPNAARLPTPPSDAPLTPQPTVQVVTNHITNALKRKIEEDEKFERARILKRQKRLQGNSVTASELPPITPLPLPEKLTKKERDRINKAGQTEDVLHRKANETASMALGGKKKYSWMTGGAASGTSTPRANPAIGSTSGSATPVQQQTDRALLAKRRQFQGGSLEKTELGAKIQMRDLIHVLETDGKDRKTLVQLLARMRSEEKDSKPPQRQATGTAR